MQPARAKLLASIAALACACLAPLPADAQEDLDDILDGFDSPKQEQPKSAQPQGDVEPASDEEREQPGFAALTKDWEIDGGLTLGSSVAFAQSSPERGQADYRGITRLRPELNLAVEVPLPHTFRVRASGHAFRDYAYALKGRSDFTHEVLREYEAEAEFDELWIAFSPLSNVDVKVGRQVAAFGPADMLRVVDVLNPIDNREPGLIDLEDLRLPVAMTRVESYLGSTRMTAIAVHESRFDKQPVFGSDFFPPNVPPLPEDRPGNGGRDTEYGFVLARTLGRTDVALYHERYFERRGRLGSSGRLEHARLSLSGISAARPFGAWLLKGELAQIRGLEFARTDDELSRTDALLGIEYSGFSETQIGLEVVMRHLHDFDSQLELPPDSIEEDTWESALRYRRDFLDNTCRLALMAFAFGSHAQNGTGARVSVLYKATDALGLELGVLTFRRGERGPFTFIKNNDRVFWKVQYSF